MREALTWGVGLVLALLLHLGIGLAVFWPTADDGTGQTDSGGTLAGEMTVLVLEDAGEGAAGADADRTAGTETGEEKPETPQAEPERQPEPERAAEPDSVVPSEPRPEAAAPAKPAPQPEPEPLPDLAPVPEPEAQPEPQQVPEAPSEPATDALPDPAATRVAQMAQTSTPPQTTPLPRPAPERPVHKPVRETEKAPPRKTASRASTSRRGDAQVSTRKGDVGAGKRAAAGGKKGERASYALKLRRRVERYKRYPPGATPGTLHGVGKLKITIDRTGRVKRASLVRKTGVAALDRELRKLARRASPFPAIPESIAGPTLTFTVPVRFGKRK
ncbi:energy transducer TonB family protein [Stappia indica]|uniref:energy transducer TonB family protein n=1 Tax=Stappia indica TaxID=538381 RepID=UPI001CD7D116|nr:TonB family protein [Stappia indica]MCA1300520.1 TonB family protein [Stappia indica]